MKIHTHARMGTNGCPDEGRYTENDADVDPTRREVERPVSIQSPEQNNNNCTNKNTDKLTSSGGSFQT